MNRFKAFLWMLVVCFLLSGPAYAQQYFPDLILTDKTGLWVDSRRYATLADAVTDIGASEATLVIAESEATDNLTIPITTKLKFTGPGSITVNAGQTLTLDTFWIEADGRQIFAGTGNVDFAVGSRVRGRWFSTLTEALLETADDSVTLLVEGAQSVTPSTVVGGGVTLEFAHAATITCGGGVVLSNINSIIAGKHQIFAGAGDFDFVAGSELSASWFASLRIAYNFITDDNVGLTLLIEEEETLDVSTTIDTYIDFRFNNGAVVTPDAAVVLTMNSPAHVKAGMRQQIIDPTNNSTDPMVFTNGGVVSPDWFGANLVPGTTDMYEELVLADTSLGALDGVIRLSGTEYLIDTNHTLDDAILLEFEHGAFVDGAGTLTVYAPENIRASKRHQIVDVTFDLEFTNGGEVSASWWGYSTGGTGANNATALDVVITALDVDGGTILIPAGTYDDDGGHTIASNISIVGDGNGPGSSGAGEGNTIITHNDANWWLTVNDTVKNSSRNNTLRGFRVDIGATTLGAIRLMAPFYARVIHVDVTQATPEASTCFSIEAKTNASALYNYFDSVAAYGCDIGFALVSDTLNSKVVNNNTFVNIKASGGIIGVKLVDVAPTQVASCNDNVWIAPEFVNDNATGVNFYSFARRNGVIIGGNSESADTGVKLETGAADGSPTLSQLVAIGFHNDGNTTEWDVDAGRNVIQIGNADAAGEFLELGDLDIDKSGNLVTEGNITPDGYVQTKQGLRQTQYTNVAAAGNIDLDALMGANYDTAYLYLTNDITITKFPYDGDSRNGTIFVLVLRQAAAGSKTVTLPAGVNIIGGAFTLTTTASRTDVLTFQYVGTMGVWAEISRVQDIH